MLHLLLSLDFGTESFSRGSKKKYLRLILTCESLFAMPDCSLPFYIPAFLLSGSPPDKFMESIYLPCGLKPVSLKKKLIFTQDSRLRFRGGLNCFLDINPYFNKLNEKVNWVPFYWLYIKVGYGFGNHNIAHSSHGKDIFCVLYRAIEDEISGCSLLEAGRAYVADLIQDRVFFFLAVQPIPGRGGVMDS